MKDKEKYFSFHQSGYCRIYDKLAEDDSYAFFTIQNKDRISCLNYQKCNVVRKIIPFTGSKTAGGRGWLFPKRSPFLPIFKKYFWELKEAGHWRRIKDKAEYNKYHLLPDQECEDLDGHPISMHKVISLFTMFFVAVFVSTAIFWLESIISMK